MDSEEIAPKDIVAQAVYKMGHVYATIEQIASGCERVFGVSFTPVGIRTAVAEACTSGLLEASGKETWALGPVMLQRRQEEENSFNHSGLDLSGLDNMYLVTGLSPPRTPVTPSQSNLSSRAVAAEEVAPSLEALQERAQGLSESMLLMRTPPTARMNVPVSPRTPQSTDRLDQGSQIRFPNRRRNIMAHLAVRMVKLVNCPKTLEGARLCLTWKWGTKEGNSGESDVFSVVNGLAMVVHNFQVVTEFVQELPSKTTCQNRMVISLVQIGAQNKRETLHSRTIDMAQFSLDRCEKTKSFALEKKDGSMSVYLSVDTTWLKIDGRKVERTNEKGSGQRWEADNAEIVALPLASPTQFAGVAARTHVTRSQMVSPVVVHQAMKDGRKSQVLEGAKTPNPTLDKMLEQPERNLVAKKTPQATNAAVPVAAITPEDSPLKAGVDRLRSLVSSPLRRESPGKGKKGESPLHVASSSSPFFRRKETLRKAREEAKEEHDSPANNNNSNNNFNHRNGVFGVSLEKVMKKQSEVHPTLKVPFVVDYCCKKVMEMNGQQSEGIFRLSIPSDDIGLYAKNFDCGNFALPAKDPNYPAVLLKNYLRKLPEPLCPEYNAAIECVSNQNAAPSVVSAALERIFVSLPQHNQDLLVYLSDFICKLGAAENVVYTKMEVAALCIVFVPAILRNPVMDYASALKNQFFEQQFTTSLVSWIQKRRMFSPSRSLSKALGVPTLKKRKSTMSDQEEEEENDVPGGQTPTGPTSANKGSKLHGTSSPSPMRKGVELN